MVDTCDLLGIIQKAPYNKLSNVQVFGKVLKPINTDSIHYEGTSLRKGSVIVEFELFAIKFNGEDYNLRYTGEYNDEHMYFCRGSIAINLIELHYKKYANDYWAITGRLSQPKGKADVVNLFNFMKDRDGVWMISPVYPEDIEADNWSSIFKSYIIKCCQSGIICQPDNVLALKPCLALGVNSDATVIKPEEEKPIQSIEDTKLTGDLSEEISKVSGKEDSPSIDEDITTNTVSNIDTVSAVDEPTNDEVSDDFDSSSHEPLSNNVLTLNIKSDFSKSNLKKLKFKGVRLDLRDKSINFDKLDDLSENLDCRQKAYLQEFSNRYPALSESAVTPPIESLLNNIIRYWGSKPTGLTRTGRTILKEYIDRSGVDVSEEYMGSTVGKYLMSLGTSLLKFTLGVDDLDCTGEALEVANDLFGSPEVVYAGLLGVITGLSVEKMRTIANRCYSLKISFSNLINSNPYSLVLLSTIFSFNEIEQLSLCLGKASDNRVRRGKNVALLSNYMMTCQGGDTIYSKSELLANGIGISVSKADYMKIRSGQVTLPKARQDELVAYVDNTLCNDKWKYSPMGWKRQGYGYMHPLSPNELSTTVTDLTMSGIGTELVTQGGSWICSTVHLSKELYVYRKSYKLALRRMSYSVSDIDKYIEEFEKMKGFKLEDRQREAVHLVMFGAGGVTGGAGSGKTTISECIVYVLKRLKGNVKVQFGAPTGKAAKRLQEVVGQPTKTMHSMFGVGVGDKDLFDELEEEDESSSEPDVYILDENAMSTLDLVYCALKHINRAQVFFLGDIDQLPPIGKGLPFRTLLQFIPYVALNVSKRSAEGSMITMNSDIIRNHSEKDDWQDLISDGNCRLLECADEEIQDLINDLCKWHLGVSKVRPEGAVDGVFDKDDIQVVSPVKTPKYSWGSAKVNPVLQNTFCPYVYGQSFVHVVGDNVATKYRLGDRVINTSTDYSRVHYSTWKDGKLEMMGNSLGITNGDVGEVVGVLHSTKCHIVKCEMECKGHEPRDDSLWVGENRYFVVVKFPDYEFGGDYYVLYRCTIVLDSSTDLEKVFNSSDLTNVELAYALSTHKMQGSQSKLVIVALGSMRNSNFLTRNMVYTAVTRGEALVYLVGNVSNEPTSALSVARRLLASDNTVTVADVALLN